jgi:SAM-dependent methyltransferase
MEQKEYTTRTTCRSCNAPGLKEVLSFGNQRVVGWGDKLPPLVPLEIVVCPKCDLLQLKHTTNSDLLWGDDYGYRSGVNETMRKELAEIAVSAEQKVAFKPGDITLDIGCNDGTLLSAYTRPFKRLGFDPSINMAKFAKEAGHEVVFDYFTAKNYLYEPAKIITAISMFYDLDDPNKFTGDVAECLDQDGVFIVQQNYLKGMIEQCAFDNICHEHIEYYSLRSIEPLLKRHGLAVFDVSTNDINGGSFRTYICHEGAREVLPSVEQMRQDEVDFGFGSVDIYRDFARRAEGRAKQLHDYVVDAVDSGKKVYAYGASTRGGTLLQFCGLDDRFIAGAADRNPDKWGKIMQSTGIPIVSEEEARGKADIFIVLPWYFREEIQKREQEFVKKGGKLVFPLPKFEIYDGNK